PDSTLGAPAMTVRLEGKPVAEAIDQATRSAVRSLPAGEPAPCLASVHRGVDSPFRYYLKRQAKAAAALGISFRDEPLGPEDGPQELIERLAAVDGVGTANLGRLVAQMPVQVPAVALAAVEIARHYRLPIEGERVVVLGRSETVGLPLALLLAGKGIGLNATVTVVHSKTRDLKAALANARTIFSCMGRAGMLTREVVPEGSCIVDVGVSTVPDPARPGSSKTTGDAD